MKKTVTTLMLPILMATAAYAQYDPYPDKSIFAERRATIMEKMGEGSIAIIVGRPESSRNSDVDYEYRQGSDLFYLTGFEEPEAVAVLVPSAEGGRFVMFVRERNPHAETWTGRRFGIEGAMEIFSADTAYTYDSFEETLPKLVRGKKVIYHNNGENNELTELVNDIYGRNSFYRDLNMQDIRRDLAAMRLIKSPKEIELLRKAIDITCEAHQEAMKSAQPGMGEYEIEAVIEYTYRKHGSQRPGFPSIVGAGANTTILHYSTNQMMMNKGDLLLIDIGAEYGYYTADVTRTIPVNGKFSKEQAAVYQVVYDAQEAAFAAIKPGATWGDVSAAADTTILDGLIRIGVLSGDREELKKKRAHKKYFIHGLGHPIGLDVHDVGTYGAGASTRPLKPGMVMTVEPGVYIKEGDESIDPKWWNIGVRIEDDLLITEDGYELLSAKAPRKIKDIEKLMRKKGLAQKD